MRIALIVASEFKDYRLLEMKLDELKVKEVISGTSNGYEMLEEYVKTRPNIKINLANGSCSHVSTAYNAINEAENVVIFANGDGKRTELAIANALKEKKNLKIYSYKSKALNIEKQDEYIKISMLGNLQKTTNSEGLFLDKNEVQSLIGTLTKIQDEIILFDNKSVDSLPLIGYLGWANNKVEKLDGILVLPPIQRGFVWKPFQIQELWDSLLRGMPIGAVMLQKINTSSNKFRKVSTSSNYEELNEINNEKEGYFLLDGQQRTLSMILGLIGSDTHRLWIDFNETGLNNSKYRLRVTTKYQPFGYSPDGRSKVSMNEKRDAYNYYEKKIKEEDFFLKTKPWKNSDKDGTYLFEFKDLWNKESEDELFESFNDEQKIRLKNFLIDLKNLEKQWIPLILVPEFKINENIEENENDDLTLLFERISSNGTKLSSEDLLFSMIKQKWSESHDLVYKLQDKIGSLMKPTDFVMTIFRISILLNNQKNKEMGDNPKPDTRYFHRHLKDLLNEEEYGLKTLIKDDSVFIQAFEKLMKVIEHNKNRNFGIPKIMFPYINLYLLQTLIYFIIKKEEDEVNELELVRFIMFWMVNNPDTKKSSDISKEMIKLINEDKNLIDIYNKLTEEERDPKILFFKLTFVKDKKVEFTNLINQNERALKYFDEKNKDLYHKFSTNKSLLLWIQREFMLQDDIISKYEPLAINNEDNVPYDFDHLIPQSNWASLPTNGSGLDKIKNEENKKRFGNLWIRRNLGNLIGNFRVLNSSQNRSRGDESLEKELEKMEIESKNNFLILEEDLDNWKKASPEENKFDWDDNRIKEFQYVIEKRVLNLYHQIIEDLKFEKWDNK